MLLGTTPGLYPAAEILPLLRNILRFLLSPNILLLDGQCGGSSSHFPQVLADLDLAFQHTTTGTRFDGWLASGKDWRLVLVDSYDQEPGDLEAFHAYVSGGGRAWWNSYDTLPATAAVLEAVLEASYIEPRTLRRWEHACCDPGHPAYRGVGPVQTPVLDTCAVDGWELGVQGGGVALAGDVSVPTQGRASLIAGNAGRTLLFGGTPGLYPAAEIQPLLRGAVRFLLSGYPIYTVETSGSLLREVDARNAQTLSGTPIALAGPRIRNGTGLAIDPQSGRLYAALERQGVAGRELVQLDPGTGDATLIGALGDQFAGLAFDCRGGLYGVTGDGTLDPALAETLFRIDPSNAQTAVLTALGNGDGGEALAFNPADGLLYHGSGTDDQVFESIDPNLAITPIPLSGDPFEQFRALTPAAPDRLYFSDGRKLFDLATSGAASERGSFDHFAKGLANTDSRCCSDPGDADCDGRLNGEDLCPFYPESDPLADADGNGRGDECECGDQNGDGTVNVADLVAINLAIFNPSQVTPLCDANHDGQCNVADIVAANLEIFSLGNTSTCGRQPHPGP